MLENKTGLLSKYQNLSVDMCQGDALNRVSLTSDKLLGENMESITVVSERERVFYFSDFIYFVNTIDYSHPHSLKVVVGRVLELLILFDKVMIPSEHITISTTSEETRFKLRFFQHKTIRLLIEQGRIVTTIWSVCRDASDHLEASSRYKREIKASIIESDKLSNIIKNIGIFKRNQKGQSGSALEQAKVNGWRYKNTTQDLLSYSDGIIEIPFSHERLLLGDGKKKFTDKSSINAAKLAYIQAMPSGNGGIFRSLIPSIELTNGESVTSTNDRLPSVFFTMNVYRQLLRMTGINTPFSYEALLHPMWLDDFIKLSEDKNYLKFKTKVFEALEMISNIVFARTEEQAKELLKHIHFVRLIDVLVLGWKMSKLHNLLPKISASHRNELADIFIFIPSYPVKEINRMAHGYK